ncbi:SH3 domain-containing protein [uncultured Tissierella sp.]|uniref:SH3 domain-containing protein n=1 Tax=uncultured Tissierella sp. TaxID=448160 RepID=UPI0028048E36|nr:SH3 domain-containing protein [uncultured Tissierella sp.]MDU5081221.1 SH3 domain-containing protein [Bacillota bacterium]
MEDKKELGKSPNLDKALGIQSKLCISEIDKMKKNFLAIENMGLRYDKVFNTGINKAIKNAMMVENIGKRYARIFDSEILDFTRTSIEMTKNIQNYYQDSINRLSIQTFKGIQDSYQGNINNMMRGLQNTYKRQIEQLVAPMKVWQSNMELMSNDFLKSYNSIVTESMKSLSSVITEINKNMVNLSSIISFNINELIPELPNVGTFEFHEGLEDEIDLQEVQVIIDSKIEDIKLTIQKQNGDIVFIINKLIAVIKENSTKGGLMESVVSGVLSSIVMMFITFIFNSVSPYTPANIDIKYMVESTKQIVRTMEVDNSFYNVIRIVVKDGLEVRRTSSMKSEIKYYLGFGDLVKIEHKNRNWTKISYTNLYTDEREIGWVLTRYTKRLD